MAMWRAHNDEALLVTMSSDLKHKEQAIAAGMKDMLVQDTQAVDDLTGQFPETKLWCQAVAKPACRREGQRCDV